MHSFQKNQSQRKMRDDSDLVLPKSGDERDGHCKQFQWEGESKE